MRQSKVVTRPVQSATKSSVGPKLPEVRVETYTALTRERCTEKLPATHSINARSYLRDRHNNLNAISAEQLTQSRWLAQQRNN